MMRPDFAPLRRLVVRMAAGDVKAFQTFFDDLSPRIFCVVSSIINDPDLAQRVTANAFVEMWRTAGTCTAAYSATGDNSVVAWAMGIAVRHGDNAEFRTDVPHAGTRSLAGQRVSVALVLHGGLTYSQVAHVLGVPSQVVAGHLHAGLSGLRSRLTSQVSSNE